MQGFLPIFFKTFDLICFFKLKNVVFLGEEFGVWGLFGVLELTCFF